MTGLIILLILFVGVAFVATSAVKIVGQAEVMVIERLGRFNRVARSGMNVLVPFVDRPRTIDVRMFDTDVNGVKRVTAGSTTRIDLREQVLSFPSQSVITKDNVTIDIDAVIYYRVADPQKATYAVQNLPFALETLTRTTLRNIVGEMELDQTLVSRDTINKRMRDVIEEASIGWGVDVTRVELQAIEPPREIQQSMELQMRAERERRAAVTQAEAGKRAAILEAEGVRESAVLRAHGMAEARLAMAQAEAETIGRIAAVLPEGEASEAAAYLLALRYFEALPAVAQGPATTLFLPAEASGVLGALGSLRTLLSKERNAGAKGPSPRAPGGPRPGGPTGSGGPASLAGSRPPAALGSGSDRSSGTGGPFGGSPVGGPGGS
jgi:regulator of protease activity HflC (stomatin/prohibitin superfamily)